MTVLVIFRVFNARARVSGVDILRARLDVDLSVEVAAAAVGVVVAVVAADQ